MAEGLKVFPNGGRVKQQEDIMTGHKAMELGDGWWKPLESRKETIGASHDKLNMNRSLKGSSLLPTIITFQSRTQPSINLNRGLSLSSLP